MENSHFAIAIKCSYMSLNRTDEIKNTHLYFPDKTTITFQLLCPQVKSMQQLLLRLKYLQEAESWIGLGPLDFLHYISKAWGVVIYYYSTQ